MPWKPRNPDLLPSRQSFLLRAAAPMSTADSANALRLSFRHDREVWPAAGRIGGLEELVHRLHLLFRRGDSIQLSRPGPEAAHDPEVFRGRGMACA